MGRGSPSPILGLTLPSGNLVQVSRHFASPEDPWFRLGRLDVNSSTLVALIAAASGLLSVFSPSLVYSLAFDPLLVGAGQVWRVVTWPLANSIWVLLTALILWWFGSDLERLVGRYRMLWLFVGIWATLTASAFLLALLPDFPSSALAGIDLIETAVLLLWIAEYPNRPFFFGIPAWIFGAVIVAMNALSLVAGRNFGGLAALVVALVVTAVMGRRFGLLSAYDWIPGKPVPQTVRTAAPTTFRAATRSETKQAERRASDRERLDELLDQINDHGMHSLTSAQRKELLRLRDRLRRG